LCSAVCALTGGRKEYHAVHVTKVGRVDDILCRDAELGAGSGRTYEDHVAISTLSKFVDAIDRFKIGGPSLRPRVAVKEFVCKSRG
jgi:hypothetical protein